MVVRFRGEEVAIQTFLPFVYRTRHPYFRNLHVGCCTSWTTALRPTTTVSGSTRLLPTPSSSITTTAASTMASSRDQDGATPEWADTDTDMTGDTDDGEFEVRWLYTEHGRAADSSPA